MRPMVYISGPITLGEWDENFQQAADAQLFLIRAGCAVLNPMLTMALPGHETITHDEWMQNDLPFIAGPGGKVDALLRLPGASAGADTECEHAAIHGVPVYHDPAKLLEDLGLMP